jgi:hypothetical protein
MRHLEKNLGRLSMSVAAGAACIAALVIVGCGPTEPEDPNRGLTGNYNGSTSCRTCHQIQHDDWIMTLHGNALASLKSVGQDTNPDCLPCHTTGYGEEGGYVSEDTTLALASVGCEECHGPARQHVMNVNVPELRPPVSVSAEICGRCHVGEHHPNFDDWSTSRHSSVTEDVLAELIDGGGAQSCGRCHTGEGFLQNRVELNELPEDWFEGRDPASIDAATCAVCHDPHKRTGNAVMTPDGRDFQLRFALVKNPVPSNDIADTTDPSRFNLCGQCHYSRGRTWQTTNRPPHPSIQANFYTGEMDTPDGTEPLVLSRSSVHSNTSEQCATCHMYRQDFMDEQAPAISGHTFGINHQSCATSGCHPSADQAMVRQETLQNEIQARLDRIAEALGDPATWEYTANGGPDTDGQASISDTIKQARFLYYYVLEDGSLGLHNPDYARVCLLRAETMLLIDDGNGGGMP